MRALGLLIPSLVAVAQVAPPPGAGRSLTPHVKVELEPAYRISEQVDLVLLPVLVKDRKGRFVSGLEPEHFKVYENGAPRRIAVFSKEDVPVTVGLVMDNSSSMKGKRDDVTAGALAFVQSSNPEDEVFVINFNEHVTFGLPPRFAFTGDLGLLRSALDLSPPDGRTALCDAVAAGLDYLGNGAHDRKALVVLSDGGDNASRRSCSEVQELARRSRAIIYSVGVWDDFDEDRNPALMKRLAKDTGGECLFPARAEDVVPVFRKIAEDLRNQYTIGYMASEEAAGYRKIRVKVSAPGRQDVRVRTREGYVAPGG